MNASLAYHNQAYVCIEYLTSFQKDSYIEHKFFCVTKENCNLKFPMSNTTKWTKKEQKSPVYVAFYADIYFNTDIG